MMFKKKLTICGLILLSLSSIGVAAMSLSDVGKMCLFSGISGHITFDGQPVKNAKVKRIVQKTHVQKTK